MFFAIRKCAAPPGSINRCSYSLGGMKNIPTSERFTFRLFLQRYDKK